MRYLLIVSHGEFSAGLHDTFEMLMGKREDVLHVGLKNGMGVPELKEQLLKVIAPIKPEDEILVVADIIGGSPLTTTMEILAEEFDLSRVRAVGGMNLPMTMAAIECEDDPIDDAVEAMVATAAEQIAPFKLDLGDDDEEEDL